MKKIIAIALMIFLSFSMAACKSNDNLDASSLPESYSSESSGEEQNVSGNNVGQTESTNQTSSQDDKPIVMAGPSELKSGSKIPEGCEYKTAEGKVYKTGDKMPSKVSVGDEFTDGEYRYKYNFICNPGSNGGKWIAAEKGLEGWGATALNRNKKAYAEMRTSINGKDVTSIYRAFELCENMESAPALPKKLVDMRFAFSQCFGLKSAPQIPDTVKNMRYAFAFCEALETAPKTPKSVNELSFAYTGCVLLKKAPIIVEGAQKIDGMFSGCTALTTAGNIPESVTSMEGTFSGCVSLTGNIVINAKTEDYTNMFSGTEKMITISGSSRFLDAIAKTCEVENVVVKK